MPIISAKDHKHRWVERAHEDFSKVRQNPFWRHELTMHIARCPGIFSLQRHGWIVRTWQDIEIETNGDGKTFTWRSATAVGDEAVDFHGEEQLANFFDTWPSHTLRTIIKIQTGWHCIVPKGYSLLEMPVALSDDHRFTAIPGYMHDENGPAPLNVQLLWHVMEGKTLIPAGTPMAQYVLVPRQLPEMICRNARPEDRLGIVELFNRSRWVKNYRDFKKLFS